MTDAAPEVRERLLKAWRGEIEARATYELIARRLPEREAEIMRRMAEAEGKHRQRLEARMRELGIEIPSPDSVRLSWWARLQVRIAPVDRLLAAREAAEDEEVDDLYKRSTGDSTTDRLLHDIRREERSHSMAVTDMRSGQSDLPEQPVMTPGQQRAKDRLDKIMGREKWHQSSGGWISGAIYGANDGLASVFGIVAGVSGATAGSSFVLTAGAAGAIAASLSMATGAFLAERSESEVAAVNLERERAEIEQHPEEEKEELSLYYQLKGIDEATADAMAEQLARNPDAMLKALAVEEFGITGDGESNAVQAAVGRGHLHRSRRDDPGDPVHLHDRHNRDPDLGGRLADRALPGRSRQVARHAAHLVGGGLEMTLAGVIVGGATYLVGLALPT